MKFHLPPKRESVQVTVVSFGDEAWGFSDASIPRLQGVLSELRIGYLEMFHNRVLLSFEEDHIAVEQALSRLRELRKEELFSQFRIGVAKGESRDEWWKLATRAIEAERKSE